MNGRACETVRDRLVEHRDGALPALEAAATQAHLDRCEECAAEARLLRELEGARRSAPSGFAERVMAAYRRPEGSPARAGRFRRPASGAPLRALPLAAAVAAVLFAGVVIARVGFGPEAPADALAVTPAEAGLAILPWPGDDGVLAGAPALDALTNDEIEALLQELDS